MNPMKNYSAALACRAPAWAGPDRPDRLRPQPTGRLGESPGRDLRLWSAVPVARRRPAHTRPVRIVSLADPEEDEPEETSLCSKKPTCIRVVSVA